MPRTVIDEKLKKLRQQYRDQREQIVLWKRPLTTLYHFIAELLHLAHHVIDWCVACYELFHSIVSLFLSLPSFVHHIKCISGSTQSGLPSRCWWACPCS